MTDKTRSIRAMLRERDVRDNSQLKAWEHNTLSLQEARELLLWKAAANLVAAHLIAGNHWEWDEEAFANLVEVKVSELIDGREEGQPHALALRRLHGDLEALEGRA